MPNSANNPEWVAARQERLKADKKPAPRSRQLAMFPRPERLTPEMARPDQFHRLPGVQWHGNYDPSTVTKPPLRFNIGTSQYTSVGVHAGTRRAAMDALDMHGPYSAEKDPNYVPYNAEDPLEMKRADEAHGPHGYLHPVLPTQILRRRETADKTKGLWRDAGDDWTGPVSLTNYRQIGKVQDKWSLDDSYDQWDERPNWHPDEVKHGLRYANESEHPGSTSTLIPTSAKMQHSDFVRDAILNGRKVHPLTERLYNDGVLDAVEAKKYLPMQNPARYGLNLTHSEAKRKARTARVRSSRKREFLQKVDQPELPFPEK